MGLPAIYLIGEIYFINAFINTYSTSTNVDGLQVYEWWGKAFSAFGIALSVVIAKEVKNNIKSDFSGLLKVWWSICKILALWFLIAFASIFFVMKSIVVYNNSPESRFCASNGHYIKHLVQSGQYSPFKSWTEESGYTNINQHQVALTILPYSFCTNADLRNEVKNDNHFKDLLYKNTINSIEEQSEELKAFRRFINGKEVSDNNIYDLHNAYKKHNKYFGSYRVRERIIKKISSSLKGHTYKDEVVDIFRRLAVSDHHNRINRSLNNFKQEFKTLLAVRIIGIKDGISGGISGAQNVLNDDFVMKNFKYFKPIEKSGKSKKQYYEEVK